MQRGRHLPSVRGERAVNRRHIQPESGDIMKEEKGKGFGEGLHLPYWAAGNASSGGVVTGDGMMDLTRGSERKVRRAVRKEDTAKGIRENSPHETGGSAQPGQGTDQDSLRNIRIPDELRQFGTAAAGRLKAGCTAAKALLASLAERIALKRQEENRQEETDASDADTWNLQRNILMAAVLLIAVLGSVAASQFYHHAQFYQNHFREGTRVNGTDVSNKTVPEVEGILAQKALDYSLTIRFRDEKSETLPKESFGYEYVSDGSVSRLMGEQDAYHWYEGLIRPDSIDARLDTSYDPELLRESILELPELQKANMKAPEDAVRVWDADAVRFEIVPEEEGTLLDGEAVFQAACDAIENGEKELDLEEIAGAYAAPAVRSDDKVLKRDTEQLNELAAVSVTLQTPHGDTVLDGETLQDWLVKDAADGYRKDTYTWNTSAMRFVDELADSIDSFGKERTFTTHSGETTVVDGNDYYGWEVDRESELQQLKSDLESGGVIVREPCYLYREAAPMSDHDGVGDSYVEVDLSKQHLWMYEEGKLLLETDVISGTMTEGRHTPEGIYYPLSMQQNAVLRGTNGGESWAAPVSYWMKLNNDGVGMHDATWQYAFGGDIYIYGGSHGCINLPLDIAKQIYENLTLETPVVVYYSQPYELH